VNITHIDQLWDAINKDEDLDSTICNMGEWVWLSIRRCLTQWEPDRFAFAFNNPSAYGDGLDTEVFKSLLEHLVDPEGLNENQLATLIGAVARACTEDEWINLYQPILLKRHIKGSEVGVFNRICPDRHDIWLNITTTDNGPSGDVIGYCYPYPHPYPHPYPPKYAVVFPDRVEWLNSQFMVDVEYECPPLEVFRTIPLDQDEYPMFFEFYPYDRELYLTDMVSLLESNSTATAERLERVAEVWMTYLRDAGILLGEAMVHTGPDDVDAIVSHFTATGCPPMDTMLCKPVESSYNGGFYAIPINLQGTLEQPNQITQINTIKQKEN